MQTSKNQSSAEDGYYDSADTIDSSSITEVVPKEYNITEKTNLLENKHKNNAKHYTLRAILVLILLVALVPVLIIVITIADFAYTAIVYNTKLVGNSKAFAKELSNLTIFNGQMTNAVPFISGGSAANLDPAISTGARAVFDLHKTLAVAETEVSLNLSRAGFTRESGSQGPYYSTDTPPGTMWRIQFKYIKDSQAIRATYIFDKPYVSCPETYICKYTPVSKENNKIYPVSGFGTLNVIKVETCIGDKSTKNGCENYGWQ